MCATECGQVAVENHHIFPVQHGGAMSGPTIPLCPTCHTAAHTLANAVWDKKPHAPVTNGVMQRLIHCINEQRRVFVANGGIAPDARRRVVAQLSEQELTAAHIVKRQLGFKSIEALIKGLIAREARRFGVNPGDSRD